MSGNNMSRPIIDNDFEMDSYFEEEEIYEDVYEYQYECKVRDLIARLDKSRNLTIDMSAYPDQYTKIQQNCEPKHVYIKAERLSFIRDKKHVHFDRFGQPY